MKIVITGTHFTPAQAVMSELLKDSDNKIIYLGRKHTREGDKSPSVESQVLPKMGVKFIPIIAGRLQRSITPYTIPSLFKIPVGFIQSFWILFREKPDVVVSFGGYLGVPVVISAWLLSIPVLLHEQTLVSSLANKISAYFADKVAISFPENRDFPAGKIVLTGNPMREGLIKEPTGVSEDIRRFVNSSKLPLVLITGGNQGAHVINVAVKDSLQELTKTCCVVHQTGDSKFRDYDNLVEYSRSLEHPDRYFVSKWIDETDLSLILRHADLAVSRAGVNTLQELSYFSIPTIVIPIERHYEQQRNARYFNELGLSQTLSQSKLSPETLLSEIKEMLGKKKKLSGVSHIVISDAAKRVALEILLTVQVTQRA